jgi:hypothetical protein
MPSVVDSLTVPELDRLARARGQEHHSVALRLRWLAQYIADVMPWAVAVGYRMAKQDRRLEPPKMKRWMDSCPGFDPKLARQRKR